MSDHAAISSITASLQNKVVQNMHYNTTFFFATACRRVSKEDHQTTSHRQFCYLSCKCKCTPPVPYNPDEPEAIKSLFQGRESSLMTTKDFYSLAVSFVFFGDVPKASQHLMFIFPEQINSTQQAVLLFAAFSHLFCECCNGAPTMFLCIVKWATDFSGTGFGFGIGCNISTYIASHLAVIIDRKIQLQVVKALVNSQGFSASDVDAEAVQKLWNEYPETGSDRLSQFGSLILKNL